MVGANLVRRLAAEGHDVSVLLRPTSNQRRLQGLEDQLHIIFGDLTDAAAIQRAMHEARPDVVFHLASTIWGRVPEGQSTAHIEVNILGTCYLLDALQRLPNSPETLGNA